MVLWLSLGSVILVPHKARAAMSCTETVADMQFGSINVIPGTSPTTTTTAAISCSGAAPSTTYRFCVNMRPGTDRSGNQRQMISGSDYLPFNLYSDSSYSTPFGSWPAAFLGGGYQVDMSSNGSGSISGNVTVYGQIPTSASASPPGAYSEYNPAASSGALQYGSTPSGGSCPVGASTTNNFWTVYATVTANCTINVSTLDFGSTSSLGAAVSSSAPIDVQCTNTTPFSIGLNNGAHATGSQRRLYSASTGQYVSYGLYLDSLFTQSWSSASSTTTCTNGSNTCYIGTGTGSDQTIYVYGRVPVQGGNPNPGTYSDTVVVTLTY